LTPIIMKQPPFNIRMLCGICIFLIFSIFSEGQSVDSNYIRQFDKKNIVEVYPGLYITQFNFTNPGERKNDYKLVANSSGYVSTYMSYKWISFKYSWAMPGTKLNEDAKLDYTSLGIRFGNRRLSFHPFYDSYYGLLIRGKKHTRDFEPFRNIQFSDIGIDIYYYTNLKRFSFSATHFSQSQIKSAGSYFIMATPLWQKIDWKNPSMDLISDSATYSLLSSNPEWISFVARAGYSYNFSLKNGKWSIAPSLLFGGGALREVHTGNKSLQGVTDVQAWLSAGYNGTPFYFYLKGFWDNLQTNLFIKNLHQVNANLSITGGYRFASLKKKIFWIL
jgi:hypothetical protein